MNIDAFHNDAFESVYQDLMFAYGFLFAIHSIYLVAGEFSHMDQQFR